MEIDDFVNGVNHVCLNGTYFSPGKQSQWLILDN